MQVGMTLGLFITFEGGEGAGKSTQVERLRAKISAGGHDVIVTREPGGTDLGEVIRALLLSGSTFVSPLVEALLFNASRSDHLDKLIRPALLAGRWVICDRFSDSTRVYQGLAGGLDEKVLQSLEEIVLAQTRPALTFILDLPATEGLKRAEARRLTNADEAVDRFEARDVSFHNRLRDGFLHIARTEPERCVVIDANTDVETIAARIWSVVEERLPV